jgi:membrane associated rhomboid family serine protease
MQSQRVVLDLPKMQRGLIGLMIANVACYVFELLALRGGLSGIRLLFLTPIETFSGYLWQPFTSFWFHDPGSVGHLLWNLLFLYLFGARMEAWWGTRRFLTAYVIYGVSGNLLTLLVAGLSQWPVAEPLIGGFIASTHLGASGAIMGVTVAWGLVHANQRINLLLLGEMTGKTFVLLLVGIQLLTALSFSNVSVTSHLGGMMGAWILAKGLWRPTRWKDAWRRQRLKRQRRKIENELRVIDGGRPPPDPKDWN